MKTMSVEEILNCEIPQGIYHRGMLILKMSFRNTVKLDFTSPEIRDNRICAAFTALYALAQGEYVSKEALINRLPHCCGSTDAVLRIEDDINMLPTIGGKG